MNNHHFEGSALEYIRKKHSKKKSQGTALVPFELHPEVRKTWQFTGEAVTPGGKQFREWFEKRILEFGNPVPNQNQQTQPQMHQNINTVNNPKNPQEIQRRDAVNKIANAMMMKNKNIQPGKTSLGILLPALNNDPEAKKLDAMGQQQLKNQLMGQQ